MEGLCCEGIDAVAQACDLLADLERHVIGCSHREDVGKASIVYHVVAALSATLSDGPAIPSLSIVELGIDDERGQVGALGSAVQDGSLEQLLCKGNFCCEFLGIELAVLHNI